MNPKTCPFIYSLILHIMLFLGLLVLIGVRVNFPSSLNELLSFSFVETKTNKSKPDVILLELQGLTDQPIENFAGFIAPNQIKRLNKALEIKIPDLNEETEDDILIAKPQEETQQPECDIHHSFGGIGIEFNNKHLPTDRGLKIAAVPTYYSAYKSGLRPGDEIVSPINSFIRGEIGTFVEIKYLRNNKISTVKIKREKICYKVK